MDDPLPIERSHTFIIGLLIALALIAAFFLWLGSRTGLSPEAREVRAVEAERQTERRPLTAEEIAEADRIMTERVTIEVPLVDAQRAEIDAIEDERLVTQSEF